VDSATTQSVSASKALKMKELLQRIYELILEPVITVLRGLWEMPSENFLGLLWAVIGTLLTVIGIGFAVMLLYTIVFAIIKAIIKAIAGHPKKSNPS